MMKCQAMSEGREHNKAAKESFVKTDARPAGKPNQDSALSAARSHNLGVKDSFTEGSQGNKSDKQKFAKGKSRPNGRLG
jgi:hypothetical protein